MNLFRALLVLCLTALCGAAAQAQTVTSTFDRDYGLSRLNTYSFAEGERDSSDPLASNTLTGRKIKDALDEELQGGGLHRPAEGAAPDFLVSFHAKSEKSPDNSARGGDFVRGILVVDFYDAATKRLVWRGVAQGAVGREMVDLRLAEEEAAKAAKALVEQFGRDVLGF